jgi:hypothetical protein
MVSSVIETAWHVAKKSTMRERCMAIFLCAGRPVSFARDCLESESESES